MIVSYVYNDKGIAEYVVIPADIWDAVKEFLQTKKINTQNPNPPRQIQKFNPRKYKGILSHLNLDIEQELINMRKEWTKNS